MLQVNADKVADKAVTPYKGKCQPVFMFYKVSCNFLVATVSCLQSCQEERHSSRTICEDQQHSLPTFFYSLLLRGLYGPVKCMQICSPLPAMCLAMQRHRAAKTDEALARAANTHRSVLLFSKITSQLCSPALLVT